MIECRRDSARPGWGRSIGLKREWSALLAPIEGLRLPPPPLGGAGPGDRPGSLKAVGDQS